MKIKNLLVMSAVLACGLTLASCDQPQTSQGGNNSTPSNGGTTVEEVHVGIGYTYTYKWNPAVADDPTTEKNETATAYGQVDFTTAFVAFYADGTISDARIDVVQIKAEAAAEGGLQIKTGTKLDDAKSVRTKLELGTEYNMVAFGGSIAEVDAQIEFFADWTVGQTLEEVNAKGHGIAHHEELEGSCTISCGDFVAAMQSAWANKTAETYEFAGEAGIAMVSGLGNNYGTWEMTADVAGVLADNGTVVAAQVDALVLELAVAEDGTISVKEGSKYVENNKLVSKKQLGDKYAMAERNEGQAGCTLEWYEQAEIIEEAALDKTAQEITALVKNEGDLAGATIYLSNYLAALAKATTYAGLEHVGPQAE